MNIVVLVKHKGQQHVHRLNLVEDYPIKVGRAWQNDIVIDDDYIDANHALIMADEKGNICIDDLGTLNGTQLNKRYVDGCSVYKSGTMITIGDATINVVNADAKVLPALRRDFVYDLARRFDSFVGIVTATILAVVAILINIYIFSAKEATGELLTNLFVGFGVGILVWCFVIGFISKIFRHKMQFTLHWIFVCVMLALSVVMSFIFEFTSFNLDSITLDKWLKPIISNTLLLFFVYGTLSLSTRVSNYRKLGVACVLAVASLTYTMVSPMMIQEHKNWSNVTNEGKHNQSPIFLVVKAITLDAHIRATDGLFTRLDSRVEKLAQESQSKIHNGNTIKLSENQ